MNKREWVPTALILCGLKAFGVSILCVLSHRLEASAVLWDAHVGEPSTHVLTPPNMGALREVARDNISYSSTEHTEMRQLKV